jgi:nucleoside-diphosphate-sugar epimerase
MFSLVTGGTGFTGSHLVRRLIERGDRVRILDHEAGLFHDELEALGAEIVLGSVTDPEVCDEATQGIDQVYHLAAIFRDVKSGDDIYHQVNVEGTRHMLDASVKHGVQRFIYCSTQGVHGHITDPPGDETSPIAPTDYYQVTKYEAEQLVMQYHENGLPSTILRPTAIFGPGDPGRWLMLFEMVDKGRFLMFGSGKAHYHGCYIDNLIEAFIMASERDEALGEAFLIGDREVLNLNDLVKLVAKVRGVSVKLIHFPFAPLYVAAVLCEAVFKFLPFKPPIFRRRVDWFRQDRAFDLDKAYRLLGYDPPFTLEQGLERTHAWYCKHGYLEPVDQDQADPEVEASVGLSHT